MKYFSARNDESKRIFITVKSYPRPSITHGETDCVAGVTEDGAWIRIYPVKWRDLEGDNRFKKWQWIEARVAKSVKDKRKESYEVYHESIKIVGTVDTKRKWESRKQIVLPLLDESLEQLKSSGKSIGLIKVAKLEKFIMEPADTSCGLAKEHALSQVRLFDRPKQLLERLPYTFKYKFYCNGHDCKGHVAQVIDWEVCQAYRKWRHQYNDVAKQLKEQFYTNMAKKDLHFFMGTPLAQHRYRVFLVIGLFYPPY